MTDKIEKLEEWLEERRMLESEERAIKAAADEYWETIKHHPHRTTYYLAFLDEQYERAYARKRRLRGED
jgi:hypothetical protein